MANGKAGSSSLVIPCRELQAKRPWFIDESGKIVEIDRASEVFFIRDISSECHDLVFPVVFRPRLSAALALSAFLVS